MTLRGRIEQLSQALERKGVDLLVCGTPHQVLTLTGYWPVLGSSLALVTNKGRVYVLAPEDEKIFAEGAAAEVVYFRAGSIDRKLDLREAMRPALSDLLGRVSASRIGLVMRPSVTTVSYPSVNIFGDLGAALSEVVPAAKFEPIDDLIAREGAVKTDAEIAGIERAIENAAEGFVQSGRHLIAGQIERDVASAARTPLTRTYETGGASRADGFAFCSSGPRSAEAYAAYQHSTHRVLRDGDAALVHINNYVNGYWTDISRTAAVGTPSNEFQTACSLIENAREAALKNIHPGACAQDVDEAARKVIESSGCGNAFKHTLGHGVGLAATDHRAKPELAPYSDELLEEGMVFNVEPAVYFPGKFGIRHCDVVLVTSDGCRVLTGDVHL